MWLKGDWLCLMCKFHNYRGEVDCRKCGLLDGGGEAKWRDRIRMQMGNRRHFRIGEQGLRLSIDSEVSRGKNEYYYNGRTRIKEEKGGLLEPGYRMAGEVSRCHPNRKCSDYHKKSDVPLNKRVQSRRSNNKIKEEFKREESNRGTRRCWKSEEQKSRRELDRENRKFNVRDDKIASKKLYAGIDLHGHEKEIEPYKNNENITNSIRNLDRVIIASVHIELFRSTTTQLTQVGCVTSDLSQSSYFQAIKPTGLESYLDNYKLSGDLLQALHMTREDDGSFLFKSQFDVTEQKENRKVCVEESEALTGLMKFLGQFQNCLIICVDEDSVAILVEKLKKIDNDKLLQTVRGFTYWSKVSSRCDIGCRDLEEYHSSKIGFENMPDFMTASDIAEVLLKSALEIAGKNKVRKIVTDLLYNLSEKIEFVKAPQKIDYDHEDIEVFCSFRRSMGARFTAKKLEQVDLFSGPDSESEDVATATSLEVKGEVCKNECASDNSLTSQASGWDLFGKIHKTPENSTMVSKASSSVWNIGYPTMKGCSVRCPYCNLLFKFPQLVKHLRKKHNNLTPWLLCGSCSRPVSPSGLDIHFGRKRGVCVWAKTK